MTVIYPETPGDPDREGPRLRPTLPMFLNARYDELEALAPPVVETVDWRPIPGAHQKWQRCRPADLPMNVFVETRTATTIPAPYVLADIAAKRRIVDLATNQHTRCVEYDEILPILALPFSDHPDYREEWRP